MNRKYAMEFTQSITSDHGLIESKVYLIILQSSVRGRYNVVDKIDLGSANSEDEANRIVDDYLHRHKL